MKKILKFGLMGIGIMFVGLVALAMLVPEETTVVEETAKTETKADAKQETKKVEKKKSEVVTKENYGKIVTGDALSGEGGSTIEEVVAILGEPDDKMESTMPGMNGEDFVSNDLSWYTADFDSIFVNFVDGKATFKAFNEQ